MVFHQACPKVRKEQDFQQKLRASERHTFECAFLSLMVPRAGDNNTRHSDNEAECEVGDMEGHAAKQVHINLDDAHKILRDDANRLKTTGGVRARWVTSSKILQEEGAWDTTGNDPTAHIEEYKKAATFIKKSHNNKALPSRRFVCVRYPIDTRA